MEKHKNIPTLRFSEFTEQWQMKKVGAITKRISIPVEIEREELYKQIGIRSHGKGLFYKEAVTGQSLGNKRVFWVKEDAFIVNIVFAWEQAVAKTTAMEIGMIASHRFPMYLPKDDLSCIDYLLIHFLTPKGKSLLELASPGGAGRNKTLGQKEFENLKFLIPTLSEQTKISAFFNEINKRIIQLKQKKTLLEQYKKGVMQKIFDREIRFNDDDGNEYPEWDVKTIGEIGQIKKGEQLNVSELTENGQYPALNGGINASGFTDKWNTDSNTITISEGGNSCGYVNINFEKFWCGGHCYAILKIDSIVDRYYLYQVLKYNELAIMRLRVGSGLPNIQKKDLTNFSLKIPSLAEQTKIAGFLSAIDAKINHCSNQIIKSNQYKKGLLQQLFC